MFVESKRTFVIGIDLQKFIEGPFFQIDFVLLVCCTVSNLLKTLLFEKRFLFLMKNQ